MKTAPVRKMTALAFVLFIVAGSLAAAGGPKDYGEMCHGVTSVAQGK